jgi:Zn-dependent M28 family amino/carboxypeptidase
MAVAVMPLTGATSAAANACDSQTNNTYKKLLACASLDGARAHQAALQAAADANDGIRAAGTSGYDASVDYVVETLEAAGYDVELDPFDFTYVALPKVIVNGTSLEVGTFSGTGSGDVTGTVVPVDLALGTGAWPADPATSTSGCEASDFNPADFTGSNDIALTQRGFCFFAEKAVNAQAAGAEAIIILNQGNTPQRVEPLSGNATSLPDGSPSNIGIPMAGISFADGVALAANTGATVRVVVDPPVETTQYNVLAELPGTNDDNVVMVGAHLDSVLRGPGIQDNGSGSAAILEVAVQMAKVKPVNTVRFAWWGAEESGLVGSTEYVAGLSQAEIDDIALYLNFDMIGSPNHVFFVYDGDDSDGEGAGPGPSGSAAIEKLFETYYANTGNSWKGTDFSGRSDYGPFIAAGVDIPSGGLFTGAEGIKTAEEAAIWGGTAGQQYDPCYHLACDTYDNINLAAYDTNVDAVAFSTLTYAFSTESVNGVKGKQVPGAPSAKSGSGSAAGYPGGSSGGLHDDEHDVTE